MSQVLSIIVLKIGHINCKVTHGIWKTLKIPGPLNIILCYLNCDLIVVTSVNNFNISFILKELFTLFFNYSGVRRKGKSPTRWNRGSIYCN